MKSKQRSAYFQLQITIITAAPQAAESRLAHMEVWPRMSFISSREYVKEMKYLSDTCCLWVLIWFLFYYGVPVKGWITNLSGYMWILFTEVWFWYSNTWTRIWDTVKTWHQSFLRLTMSFHSYVIDIWTFKATWVCSVPTGFYSFANLCLKRSLFCSHRLSNMIIKLILFCWFWFQNYFCSKTQKLSDH